MGLGAELLTYAIKYISIDILFIVSHVRQTMCMYCMCNFHNSIVTCHDCHHGVSRTGPLLGWWPQVSGQAGLGWAGLGWAGLGWPRAESGNFSAPGHIFMK